MKSVEDPQKKSCLEKEKVILPILEEDFKWWDIFQQKDREADLKAAIPWSEL